MAYVVRPARRRAAKLEDDYWVEQRETMEVIVESDEAQDTGLVDLHGNKIFRVPTRGKVGF